VDAHSEKGWLSRNWKWVVPTGCVAVTAAVVVFAGVAVMAVLAVIRHSSAYAEAVARAKGSSAVRRALGEPIEEGLFVSGAVNVQPTRGTAELWIPLSGPKGRGTLHARGALSGGRWVFSTLTFGVAGSDEEIDLLEEVRAERTGPTPPPGPAGTRLGPAPAA